MALSVSQSRSRSSWTNDLLDLQHCVSEDGSRIDDSRILRFVKQRRDSSCSSVETHTVDLGSRWSKIKEAVTSASKVAKIKEEDGEESDQEDDVENQTQSPSPTSSPASHKKKRFSKILKRMFGKTPKGKYQAEELIVIETEPQPSREIFVKEYDPTSDSVARFNDFARRTFANSNRDEPSVNSLASQQGPVPSQQGPVPSQRSSRI
uniref:Uncharacterized protein n=1 Tax=Clytia hemisphaerica TaxID=252671 RepID=A0A7M5UPW7_9CNID